MNLGEIRWNAHKDELLKRTRGVSFEEILKCRFVDIIANPNKPWQKFLLYERKSYIWAVPFVTSHDGIFLKTLYPSRKYTRVYLGGDR